MGASVSSSGPDAAVQAEVVQMQRRLMGLHQEAAAKGIAV